jgi:hypothetical protein
LFNRHLSQRRHPRVPVPHSIHRNLPLIGGDSGRYNRPDETPP